MFKQVVYKANLYKIDDDFTLRSDDLRSEIRRSHKQKLNTIYVVKYLNGYKEILTGKYFSKYTKVYNPKKGLGVIPTSKPIFVIDDLNTLNPIDMQVADRVEVQKYINNNYAVTLNASLNILEQDAYSTLNEAKIKYLSDKTNAKILRRMK